ncbi:MAG: hypothetical protein WC003_11450 [Terrimicrobiaceae bacterium]
MKPLLHILLAVIAASSVLCAVYLYKISSAIEAIPTVKNLYDKSPERLINMPDHIKRMPLVRLQGSSVDAGIHEPLKVNVENSVLDVRAR